MQTITATKFETYRVTATPKYPAWDERGGFVYEVTATSKSKAIQYARRQCKNDGHLGVIYFKAEAVEQ